MSNSLAHRMSKAAALSFAAGGLKRYGLLGGVFLVALILRAILPLNTDTSWLLTIGNKVLDGAIPYVDILEVNPPASILLYLPAVWLSRLVPLSGEFIVGALVFGAAVFSLLLAMWIVAAAKLFDRENTIALATLFAAILLVLPANAFTQREHIALITFMPALAVFACRAKRLPPHWLFALLAGIGAGITVIIKPHLVFSIVFASAAAAYAARSWRVLFAPENWIAAALAVAYAVYVFTAYPAFITEMLPLVTAVYLPVRADPLKFLIHFATPVFAMSLYIIWSLKGRSLFAAPYSVLVAAAIGFSISYYSQLKGWAYHAYPMLALIVAAVVIAFAQRWPLHAAESPAERKRRLANAIFAAVLAGTTFLWMSFQVDMRAVTAALRGVIQNPKVLSISGDIAVGHPLTRQIGGTWVSRLCNQWIATGAMILQLQTNDATEIARLNQYIERDRKMLLEDIRSAKPDFVLADRMRFDWLKWAQSDAELARELENYVAFVDINDILVLRRK